MHNLGRDHGGGIEEFRSLHVGLPGRQERAGDVEKDHGDGEPGEDTDRVPCKPTAEREGDAPGQGTQETGHHDLSNSDGHAVHPGPDTPDQGVAGAPHQGGDGRCQGNAAKADDGHHWQGTKRLPGVPSRRDQVWEVKVEGAFRAGNRAASPEGTRNDQDRTPPPAQETASLLPSNYPPGLALRVDEGPFAPAPPLPHLLPETHE